MTAGKITLRTCNCCGEAKKSSEFSFTPPNGYAMRCRECGVWLYLLRQAFGDTRDWEANKERARLRARDKNRKPAAVLWAAWMGQHETRRKHRASPAQGRVKHSDCAVHRDDSGAELPVPDPTGFGERTRSGGRGHADERATSSSA